MKEEQVVKRPYQHKPEEELRIPASLYVSGEKLGSSLSNEIVLIVIAGMLFMRSARRRIPPYPMGNQYQQPYNQGYPPNYYGPGYYQQGPGMNPWAAGGLGAAAGGLIGYELGKHEGEEQGNAGSGDFGGGAGGTFGGDGGGDFGGGAGGDFGGGEGGDFGGGGGGGGSSF